MKRPRWTGLSRKQIGNHAAYMAAYRAARKARDIKQICAGSGGKNIMLPKESASYRAVRSASRNGTNGIP